MQFPKVISINDLYKIVVGKNLMVFCIIILVIGLPLSPFLVGFSQFFLLFNWVLEWNWAEKFRRFKNNRIIWVFLILPIIHGLWLINTTDFLYALHDIKIKLPLLLFPVVLGTSNPLPAKALNLIFKFFLFAVFSGTMVTMAIITGIYHHPYNDIRDTSIFISHIRFGLMILFSLIITSYYIFKAYKNNCKGECWGYSILFTWFLFFLIILQSVTSWVVLFFLLNFLFFFYYRQIKWLILKRLAWAILISFLVSTLILFGKVCFDFYYRHNAKFAELPTHTPHGNVYRNDTLSDFKENGHFVNILISYKELAETWPHLSKIPFNEKDKNGNPIQSTMIRYLASKGLPKDREGLMDLDEKDIQMIENGRASCVYRNRFVPYVKVYEVVWELDRYTKTGDANYKSVSQRIEYWKAAGLIIKKNVFFGVGTGDLNHEFANTYNQMNSKLDLKNRLRAHNQYITFTVAFGLIGLILALWSLFLPAYYCSKNKSFILVAFLFIVFLSMFNEDTLETQAGVSFYILFYTLLIFTKYDD